MKEITVLTDVQMSPDSPELVLVHQRICVVDGDLRLVGEPTESKVSLLFHRVRTSVKWMASPPVREGAIVAEVKNTGFTPVEITSVVFRVFSPLDSDSGNGTEKRRQEKIRNAQLFPKDRNQGNLLPNESEEWYLPIGSVQTHQSGITSEFPPDKYKLVVLSGKQVINEVPGEQLQPLFAAMEEAREPLIRDSLRMVLLSLPVTVRDRLDQSLKSLSEMPVDRWSAVHGLEKLEDSLYLLELPPDHRVLLRRFSRGRIEVIDVARTPDRQPVAANG